MRIHSFHIDSFSFFHDQTVKELPPKFAIFLGKNEAGKSTLLDFFRLTLMGYPQRKNNRIKNYLNGHGPQGGDLLLNTIHGDIQITRRPNKGPIVIDPHGNPIDIPLWERLLSGITPEVYTNIYGFSLAELQSFETLTTDNIRNALYGASFGSGLQSPSEVIKSLDNSMNELFKPKGSTQPIAEHLQNWEEINKQLIEAEKEAASYDNYALELKNSKLHLTTLHSKAKDLEQQRYFIEKRLAIWHQWEKWRLIQTRLELLDPISKSFPQDGANRMERALEKKEQAAREVKLATNRLNNTLHKLQQCQINHNLLHIHEELQTVTEHKSNYKTALITIPNLEAKLQQTNDSLQQELLALGTDWSIEKINTIDRSISVHEKLECLSIEMQLAEETYNATAASIHNLNKELELARQQELEKQIVYEKIPTLTSILNDTNKEILKRMLVQAEEAEHRLPEKRSRYNSLYEDFKNLLAQFHLHPKYSKIETILTLLHEQDTAMEMVKAIQEKTLEEIQTKNLLDQTNQRVDQLKLQLKQIEDQIQQLGVIDSKDYTLAYSQIDTLKTLLHLFSRQKIRVEEIQDHYQIHSTNNTPKNKKSLFIVTGSLSSFIGCGIISIQHLMNISIISLSQTITIPIPIWSGYFFLFTGIAIASKSLFYSDQKLIKHTMITKQLNAKYENALANYTELQNKIYTLCKDLCIENPSLEDIEKLDSKIEQKKELYVRKEHLKQEHNKYQEEIVSLHQQISWYKKQHDHNLANVLSAKNIWHEYILGFGIQFVPKPEQISMFFLRIETARSLWSTIELLTKDIAELESYHNEFTEVVKQTIGEHLSSINWNSVPDIISAVKTTLNSYQDNELHKEYLQTLKELQLAQAQTKHLIDYLQQVKEQHKQTKIRYDNACTAWSNYLISLNLDPTLTPSTIKNMFKQMDFIELLNQESQQIQYNLAIQQKEKNAFILSIKKLCQQLGYIQKNDDWLMTLDNLVKDVTDATLISNEKKTLEEQKSEYEDEVKHAQLLLNDANQTIFDLLQLANVDNPETFFQHYTIKQKQAELYKQHEEVEAILRLAAKDISSYKSYIDFNTFLHSFSEIERKDLEVELNNVSSQLTDIKKNIETLSNQTHMLEIRLEHLISSDTLYQMKVKQAAIVHSMQDIAKKWSCYALAKYLLLEAKSHFEQKRQPEVIRIASNIFNSITGGKWTGINSSLEEMSLKILSPHGEPVQPELLSRGTQEQLYLSLRLAHIHNHAIQASPLPIIMDDILVNFDPERTKHTINTFIELTNSPQKAQIGHQILFFTCHPHIATQLIETIPESKLYHIEDRKIFLAS